MSRSTLWRWMTRERIGYALVAIAFALQALTRRDSPDPKALEAMERQQAARDRVFNDLQTMQLWSAQETIQKLGYHQEGSDWVKEGEEPDRSAADRSKTGKERTSGRTPDLRRLGPPVVEVDKPPVWPGRRLVTQKEYRYLPLPAAAPEPPPELASAREKLLQLGYRYELKGWVKDEAGSPPASDESRSPSRR